MASEYWDARLSIKDREELLALVGEPAMGDQPPASKAIARPISDEPEGVRNLLGRDIYRVCDFLGRKALHFFGVDLRGL